MKESVPLIKQHWAEIALNQEDVPLDPDWDRYLSLDRNGQIVCYIARDQEGQMVGYVAWIITRPLHYVSTLYAITDIFWLHPDHREGWTGVKLFTGCMKGLRDAGVRVVDFRVKDTFKTGQDGRGRVGKLLTRILKARRIETVYELVLK